MVLRYRAKGSASSMFACSTLVLLQPACCWLLRPGALQRRVKAAATDASAAAAPKAEKGRGREKGKQNADGKNQAR